MNRSVYSSDFMQSFPEALQNDPSMMALGRTVTDELHRLVGETAETIIYTRIDELPEAALDLLAYDFKVDWWDYGYGLAEKRETLKNSWDVHRRLGTKFAVETALGSILPGTRVQEWFEYGGEPYTFRVILGAGAESMTKGQKSALLERVRFYKNLRSRLKSLVIEHPSSVQTENRFRSRALRVKCRIGNYMVRPVIFQGLTSFDGSIRFDQQITGYFKLRHMTCRMRARQWQRFHSIQEYPSRVKTGNGAVASPVCFRVSGAEREEGKAVAVAARCGAQNGNDTQAQMVTDTMYHMDGQYTFNAARRFNAALIWEEL